MTRTAAVIYHWPSEHAIGSRGGFTTKIHLLVDGRGQPRTVLLTLGFINDAMMFAQLIGSLRVPRNGPGRPRTDWAT